MIHRVNLQAFDLNLLNVFDALMAERSATRAGKRLGLSQSAVSNALNRLRREINDPLFVRVGSTMVPTATALQLGPLILSALQQVRNALGPRAAFEPAESQYGARIVTTDYGEAVAVARIVPQLRSQAPRMSMRCTRLSRIFELPTQQMERGDVDFALGHFGLIPPGRGLRTQSLFSDRWVVLSGRATRQMTLKRFVAQPHIQILYSGEAPGIVGEALRGVGMNRATAVVTSHFGVLAHYLQDTDLLTVVPERLAALIVRPFKLRVHRLPLPLPRLEMALVWHERSEYEPSHQWLRGLFRRATY